MATVDGDFVDGKEKKRNDTDRLCKNVSRYFYIPGYSADVVDFPSDEDSSSQSEEKKNPETLSKEISSDAPAVLIPGEIDSGKERKSESDKKTDILFKNVSRYFYIPGYSADVVDFPSDEDSPSESEEKKKRESVSKDISLGAPGPGKIDSSIESSRAESQYLSPHEESVTQEPAGKLGRLQKSLFTHGASSYLQVVLDNSDPDWMNVSLQIHNSNAEAFISNSLNQQRSLNHQRSPSSPQSNAKDIVHGQFTKSLEVYLQTNSPIKKGKFVPIGSTYSGFNTAQNRDFDFLYECPWPAIWSFQKSSEHHGQILDKDGASLPAQESQKEFRNLIEKAIRNISFPEHFTFSGYARPNYSGTRANGPAITCLLEDDRDPGRVITVDITFAFVAPESERSAFVERLRREPCWQSIQGLSELCYGPSHILHIIPFVNPSMEIESWKLTTAVLETRLPKSPEVENIVRTIEDLACKLSLKSSKEVIDAMTVLEETPPLLSELEKCMQSEVAKREQLGNKLFDEHIFLPNYVQPIYHEKTKAIVSVSSAAVKFYVFGEIAKERGYLDEDKCVSIIQGFFQHIPAPVKHPFLFYDMKSVQLAVYAACKHTEDFHAIFKSRAAKLM